MQDNLKFNLKEIANLLNKYVKSKDFAYMTEIEETLKKLFFANTVKFWKYDKDNKVLNLMALEKYEAVSLDTSLTKQAINSKSFIFSNHTTSYKYYVPAIDNPLTLRIKSLMIFPIVKGENVLGVLKVYRGMRERKVFTKYDETILKTLSVLLLKIIEAKSIDKEELLGLLDKKPKKRIPLKRKENKSSSFVQTRNTRLKHQPGKLEIELQSLKEKFKKSVKELKSFESREIAYKTKITTLQNELGTSKENLREKELLKKELTTFRKRERISKDKLEHSERKYKELHTSSLLLSSKIKGHQDQIKKLDEELEIVNKDNTYLKRELSEEKKSNKIKSIKQLKSEKTLRLQKKSRKSDRNIEFILQEIDRYFEENEYSYMLFELMIYALKSKSGMTYIENKIKESNLLPDLMKEYHYQGVIKTYNDKYLISDFVKKIQSYEKKIFSNILDFDISINKQVPVSLVFDAPKMQSISLHLLLDLYEFIDHDRPINIRFTYNNKRLSIEIGGFINQNNSLFKSMVHQIKLIGNEKDRFALQFSRQLINKLLIDSYCNRTKHHQLSRQLISKLKGNIETIYNNDYYKFILSIPAEVMKL